VSLDTFIKDKWDCLNYGGYWRNFFVNFDDIFEAMVTLFGMANTAGWAVTMYRGAASRGIDLQPERLARPYMAFFFIAFIVIGSFFILNLFVGVVISTYNRQKEKHGKDFLLDQKQKNWVKAQLLIFEAQPIKSFKVPTNRFRLAIYNLVMHPNFDWCIMLCIFLNTVLLAVKWLN